MSELLLTAAADASTDTPSQERVLTATPSPNIGDPLLLSATNTPATANMGTTSTTSTIAATSTSTIAATTATTTTNTTIAAANTIIAAQQQSPQLFPTNVTTLDEANDFINMPSSSDDDYNYALKQSHRSGDDGEALDSASILPRARHDDATAPFTVPIDDHVHFELPATIEQDPLNRTIPVTSQQQQQQQQSPTQTRQIRILPPRQPSSSSTASRTGSSQTAPNATSAIASSTSSGSYNNSSDLPGEPRISIEDETDLRIFQILGIDPQQFAQYLRSDDEYMFEQFINTAQPMVANHQDIISYLLPADQVQISCINWKNRQFITGTDIVRLVLSRFVGYSGRNPLNMKKFEEGIFSDLRRLQAPADCVLEATRSDFLVFLFNLDCVRSKKKQKVFFWRSFVRYANSLLCDAIERELARKVMAEAVGMSVEDFVKSGIVPTGSSASAAEMSRWSLSFDWTAAALNYKRQQQQQQQQQRGGGGYLSVDQIHVIRNDISALFNRYLRPILNYRREHFAEIRLSTSAEIVLDSRISSGRVISRPSLLAEGTSGGLADNEESAGERYSPSRQPAASASSGAGRKRGPRLGKPSSIPTITTGGAVVVAAAKPTASRGRKTATATAASGRQAAVAAKARMFVVANTDEYEGESGGESGAGSGASRPHGLRRRPYDDDDTFSLSTISSNEEEVRALISPRIRVAPIPIDYAVNTQSYPPYSGGGGYAPPQPPQPQPQPPAPGQPCPTCFRLPSGPEFYPSEDDARRFQSLPAANRLSSQSAISQSQQKISAATSTSLPPTPEMTPMMAAKRRILSSVEGGVEENAGKRARFHADGVNAYANIDDNHYNDDGGAALVAVNYDDDEITTEHHLQHSHSHLLQGGGGGNGGNDGGGGQNVVEAAQLLLDLGRLI